MAEVRATSVLFSLFESVRARLSLGIEDYSALVAALADGEELGISPALPANSEWDFQGVQRLRDICQLLWGKTPEQALFVGEKFDQFVSQTMRNYQDRCIRNGYQTEVRSRQDLIKWFALLPEEGQSTPRPSSTPIQLREPIKKPNRQELAPDTKSQSTSSTAQREVASDDRLGTVVEPKHPVPGMARLPDVQLPSISRTFNLEGEYPVAWRDLKHAWRMYRMPKRGGARVELSIDQTIRGMEQHGWLLVPVFLPRVQNTARLLILMDCSEVMVPFQRQIDLLKGVVDESGLRALQILYFKSAPEYRTYTDFRSLGKTWFFYTQPEISPKTRIPLAEVATEFAGSGTLVVSDFGIARGLDEDQLLLWERFIERLRDFTPFRAAINPYPKHRWMDTPLDIIRESLPMFSYTRLGVERAVQVLRGGITPNNNDYE